MAAGAFLQGGNGFIGGRVGAVSPACLTSSRPSARWRSIRVFGVKVIFPCSTLGLKEVTDSDVGLLANALGNDNLKLSFYGDKFHAVLSVRKLNCKTVQSSRASVNEDDMNMICFIAAPWHRTPQAPPRFRWSIGHTLQAVLIQPHVEANISPSDQNVQAPILVGSAGIHTRERKERYVAVFPALSRRPGARPL